MEAGASGGYRRLNLYEWELAGRAFHEGSGTGLEVEFTTLAIRRGYSYAEVPIAFYKRRGASKLRFFRDCARFLVAGLRCRFS